MTEGRKNEKDMDKKMTIGSFLIDIAKAKSETLRSTEVESTFSNAAVESVRQRYAEAGVTEASVINSLSTEGETLSDFLERTKLR